MNVLIADDDPISRELLADLLADAGHEVRCAADGREALEMMAQGPCQLVVTDWEMPVMDGLDLCRAVRAGTHGGEATGYVYVLLLTSHDSHAERLEGLTAGADDFVTKPFDPDEMLARVRNAERIVSLETRDVAIFALAKLAESRDTDTGAHLERVQGYSRVLAQQLLANGKHAATIDAEYVRLLHGTSPLHDIGKVGIPDAVLLKPGRLSDLEFEIMKTHASLGAETLDAAVRRFPGTGFLKMARDIAATHHERFDGTGYPNGLAGEDIPLCGRIVALADVYDALTSRRVYKAAFTHIVARDIIVKDAGTHFDPDVVEAFVSAEATFLAIRERFAEHGGQAAPLALAA